MATQIIMPQMGESVVEGTITKWLKSRGEQVKEYEPLVEVNTDKVDTEIPSPISGTLLEILVAEGIVATAGTLLGWIGQPGEALPKENQPVSAIPQPVASTPPPAPVQPPLPVPKQPSAAGHSRDLGFISPVVSRLAAEYHIDLFQVPGSGLGGRITKKDMLDYLEKQKMEAEAPKVERIPPAPLPQPSLTSELVLLSTTRRAIAEHMLMSKNTSAHVTTVMEADLSRVIAHRNANKEGYARDGVNLTFTAYFVSAAVAALKASPMVNSSWTDQGILMHRQINIGMAVSLGDEGLIVPVIKNADSLSLLGLARAINDLTIRARIHKLQPDEVKGGTFTITNHGVSNSLFATPIINQPQIGILGVGAIQKRVVVVSNPNLGDVIAIRPMVYLTLTFDHRILDGVAADGCLGKVVETLQNWD